MSEVFDIQQQWFDKSGNFAIGGLVYYGKPDTDPTKIINQIEVFPSRALQAPLLPNPQTIGADGRVENKPWLNQRYSIEVQDVNEDVIFSSQDTGENPSTGEILALSSVAGINTITAESPAGITEYQDQQVFTMRLVATNTGDMTINIDGVGPIPLKITGQQIPAGALLANIGIDFSFNSNGNNFDLLSSISSASPLPVGQTNPNSIKFSTLEGASGEQITEIDAGTIVGGVDTKVPTQKAVETYAIRDAAGTVSASNIATNAVGQSEIANSAVGQGELKTTTAEISTTGTGVLFTLASGTYGWWPQVKTGPGGQSGRFLAVPVTGVGADGNTLSNYVLGSAGFITRMILGEDSTIVMFSQQRFVQASPPYNIGDGEVHSFIFAIVDNSTGKIESMSHAPDPIWANNGPTCIRPEYYRGEKYIAEERVKYINKKGKEDFKIIQIEKERNVKPYRQSCIIDSSKDFEDPDRYKMVEQEITMEFKNSDMALIPHPFQGNDLTGKSIILIDPNDPIVERAEIIKNAGESAIQELFINDYVRFGNEHLKGRLTPCPEVMVVKPYWKNSR